MWDRFLKSGRLRRLKQFFWDSFVNTFLSSFLCPIFIRNFFLRILGCSIGKSSTIHGNCYIGSKKISLGNNSFINRRCLLDNENGSKISIGDNCSVGYNVSFLTANHDFSDAKKRGGKLIAKDITIGDGCWIGANVTILAGIVIGNSSVIAAGAVVTKNCEPNAVYAGVPAIKIKSIK